MKRRGFWGALLGLPLFGFLQPMKEVDEKETIVKWIDVSERLPELGVGAPPYMSHRVLIACRWRMRRGYIEKKIRFGYLWKRDGGIGFVWTGVNGYTMGDDTVTHWAKLPSHPDKESLNKIV